MPSMVMRGFYLKDVVALHPCGRILVDTNLQASLK